MRDLSLHEVSCMSRKDGGPMTASTAAAVLQSCTKDTIHDNSKLGPWLSHCTVCQVLLPLASSL